MISRCQALVGPASRPPRDPRSREEARLPGVRIHDCRHTWASQGVINGAALTTVGRLLGHRKRRTTAIYAHLDDAALQDAAAQAAGVIAEATGYRTEPPPSTNFLITYEPHVLGSAPAREPDSGHRHGVVQPIWTDSAALHALHGTSHAVDRAR